VGAEEFEQFGPAFRLPQLRIGDLCAIAHHERIRQRVVADLGLIVVHVPTVGGGDVCDKTQRSHERQCEATRVHAVKVCSFLSAKQDTVARQSDAGRRRNLRG